MADRTCSIDGCSKTARARNWCPAHYRKWKVYGDPLAGRSYGQPVAACKVSGCEKPGNGGHGWCNTHYRRWYRHGSPFVTSRIVGDDVARFETYLRHGEPPPHAPELGPCWLWAGALTKDGYGVMEVQDLPTASAHRWSYRHHVGPLPEVLELDHLCLVTSCVNPWHLDPVPHAENVRRVNARKTHCPQGHPYSGDNLKINATSGARMCRTCQAERARNRAS